MRLLRRRLVIGYAFIGVTKGDYGIGMLCNLHASHMWMTVIKLPIKMWCLGMYVGLQHVVHPRLRSSICP